MGEAIKVEAIYRGVVIVQASAQPNCIALAFAGMMRNPDMDSRSMCEPSSSSNHASITDGRAERALAHPADVAAE